MTRREQTSLALMLVLVGLGTAFAYRAWSGSFGPSTPGAAPSDVDTRLTPPPSEDLGPTVHVSTPKEASAKPSADGFFPGVDPDKLAAVRDDRVFLGPENDAWLNLFDVLAKADPAALEKASLGPITFAQLFGQPDVYRGKLVEVQGTVVRATAAQLGKPHAGLDHYYQLWLRPDDNPNVPIVIHCLHLPPGFPQGVQISEQVRITGFFYKRWAYSAQDGPRVAPLLMAANLTWLHEPASPTAENTPAGLSLSIILAGSVVMAVWLALTVWGRGRRRAAQQPQLPEQIHISPPPERDEP